MKIENGKADSISNVKHIRPKRSSKYIDIYSAFILKDQKKSLAKEKSPLVINCLKFFPEKFFWTALNVKIQIVLKSLF